MTGPKDAKVIVDEDGNRFAVSEQLLRLLKELRQIDVQTRTDDSGQST